MTGFIRWVPMIRLKGKACPATWCAAACLVLFCGCGGGPRQYTVTGEVSYEGQPVAEGEIVFADAEGSGPTATASIENGKYEIKTIAGKKKVRITATRETGKIIEGAMGAKYPERVDLIPPKYNTATTLVRTVDPNGDRVLDFRLP